MYKNDKFLLRTTMILFTNNITNICTAQLDSDFGSAIGEQVVKKARWYRKVLRSFEDCQ